MRNKLTETVFVMVVALAVVLIFTYCVRPAFEDFPKKTASIDQVVTL